MNSQSGTLVRSWVGLMDDYPIRVEEHRIDLAYIVEFYDAMHEERSECISHCPRSGRELSIEALVPEEALQPA